MNRQASFEQSHRSVGKWVALGVSSVLILGIIFSTWLMFVILVPVNPNSSNGEITEGIPITITEGTGVSEIAKNFEQQGLIRSAFGFKVYVQLTDTKNQLQAGEYVLAPSSPRNIVRVLTEGPTTTHNEKSITIVEGWDSNEIQDYLLEQGLNVGDFGHIVDEAQTTHSDSFIFDGKPEKNSLEGYLFPDTYSVFDDVTSQELVDLMITTMESKITEEMRAKIEQSDMSFYEILTLASIVEKEVAKPEDRKIVAGIFLNRLKDDYLLQSDATVNFITGKNTTRPNSDDLITQSPYNTYLFTGLPPGPIASPSIDSIDAVLNPVETEYYFFLTTPENETIFSTTNEEHIANTLKYYPE